MEKMVGIYTCISVWRDVVILILVQYVRGSMYKKKSVVHVNQFRVGGGDWGREGKDGGW